MIVIFAGVLLYFFPVGEDKFDIITPLIGIVGAVLGGVISGGLTLWGVKLGLDKEKNNSTFYRYLSLSDQLLDFEHWVEKNEYYLEYIISAKCDYGTLLNIYNEGLKYEKLWAKIDVQLTKLLRDYNDEVSALATSVNLYEELYEYDEEVTKSILKGNIERIAKGVVKIGKEIVKRKQEISDTHFN